jgi:hypothetical protein
LYSKIQFKYIEEFVGADRAFTMEFLKIEGFAEILNQPGPNEKVTEVFAKFEDKY